MESLTEKVLLYQKTREGLYDIVDALAPRVYQFPRRKMGWDEDACGEIFVFETDTPGEQAIRILPFGGAQLAASQFCA